MVTTTSMATRSSLELMLDKLQQLEEQPPDTLPPLPARARRARPPRPPGRHSQRNGIAAASHHFLEKVMLWFHQIDKHASIQLKLSCFFCLQKLEFGELKEGAERGVCKIQKCYRGYRVRCCYWELKRGVIALQSCKRLEYNFWKQNNLKINVHFWCSYSRPKR